MKRSEIRQVEWNGVMINSLRLPEAEIPRDAPLYTVRRGDMLDWIAYLFYGDESQWYLIADANYIDDPLKPLEPGRVLVIP